MYFEVRLNSLKLKALAVLSAAALCGVLSFLAISEFIVGTLADERIEVDRADLAYLIDHLPDSARLHAKLAEAEVTSEDRDFSSAELHALRAVALSPRDYNHHVLLASIKEFRGDRAGAEEALRAALSLAPNNVDVHWRLANLLLRDRKLGESLEEFRLSVAANSSLLPVTLDLVWQASEGNPDSLELVTGAQPGARLVLAQFLLKKSRTSDSATVFSSVDKKARLERFESSVFLNDLIAANNLEIARVLWTDLVGDREPGQPLLTNGSFEFDPVKNFAQFDWLMGRTDYAEIAIDPRIGRTGRQSLRVNFAGRDTTRLDDEIKQLVLVRAGARYRLECYAKAPGLVTPEGPRIIVTPYRSSDWIARSDAVTPGSDWQKLVVDFVAPAGAAGAVTGIQVSIKRRPMFSYDEPTRGTIWFDDFSLIQR